MASGPRVVVQPSNTIQFTPNSPSKEPLNWLLPPSKSHLIRWLLISALCEGKTRLNGVDGGGEDIEAMVRGLRQFGVKITKASDFIEIQSRGHKGFIQPKTLIHCGNSGTTLRLLTALASSIGGEVMLDGDPNLRQRSNQALEDALRQLGVEISHPNKGKSIPVRVNGPWKGEEVTINVDKSSQPLSAIILNSATEGLELSLTLQGSGVSRRHAELSLYIAAQSGSMNQIDWNNERLHLSGWTPKCQDVIDIPGDASLASFALLWVVVHQTPVRLIRWPNEVDAIGHELLMTNARYLGVHWEQKGGEFLLTPCKATPMAEPLSLRDANDLLPPLAAILAIGGGGEIIDIEHARLKESDRIEETLKLLSVFGLKAEVTATGVRVTGGGTLMQPPSCVDSNGDHRLAMVAMILASKIGGLVSGYQSHKVTDPLFMERMALAGFAGSMFHG